MSQTTLKIHNTLHSDHSELDSLLKDLLGALESGDARRGFEKLDLFWARLAMHIRAEHLHLFPTTLRAVQDPGQSPEHTCELLGEKLQSVVAQLREDHDFFMRELAGMIRQMRELDGMETAVRTNVLSSVREKVIALSLRLGTHNELEETGIYQLADALLDSTERANLNERLQKELDNLPPRFGGV